MVFGKRKIKEKEVEVETKTAETTKEPIEQTELRLVDVIESQRPGFVLNGEEVSIYEVVAELWNQVQELKNKE